MIHLNGKTFTRKGQPTTPTTAGTYTPNKRSITLYDHTGTKIGVITRHGVLARATKLDDGQWWYSYADIPQIGAYNSFAQQTTETAAALAQHNIQAS